MSFAAIDRDSDYRPPLPIPPEPRLPTLQPYPAYGKLNAANTRRRYNTAAYPNA